MLKRWLAFWVRYLTNDAPWDTGITPPEIVSLVEDERLEPGRAVDLGCGTGTTSIYLARHGWDVVGIDFIAKPLREAKHKARKASVAGLTSFIKGDVSRLSSLDTGGAFDLAVDIGCGHSIPEDSREAYARSLAECVVPGGLLMLYMFIPTPDRDMGLPPQQVEALFSPAFELKWMEKGIEVSNGFASAWYRFERVNT